MNGSVGGSVEMKFTSIGGGSKFKVPSSPRTYVLLEKPFAFYHYQVNIIHLPVLWIFERPCGKTNNVVS